MSDLLVIIAHWTFMPRSAITTAISFAILRLSMLRKTKSYDGHSVVRSNRQMLKMGWVS